jgi:hypothetical protein
MARFKQQQYTAALRANDVGVEVKEPELANVGVVCGTPLTTAVKNYLENVKRLKSHKTWCAYRRADELFAQRCKARMVEAITKQDVLDHNDYLSNELGLDSRTMIMLDTALLASIAQQMTASSDMKCARKRDM